MISVSSEGKHKGFSLPEILVACAVIVSLSAAAFLGLNYAQQLRKLTQMYRELTVICHGALEYESLSFVSLPPKDLAALLVGLEADASIDNTEHKNFLGSAKLTENGGNTSEILDPWGHPYVLDGNSRTVTCNAVDAFGQYLEPVVMRF